VDVPWALSVHNSIASGIVASSTSAEPSDHDAGWLDLVDRSTGAGISTDIAPVGFPYQGPQSLPYTRRVFSKVSNFHNVDRGRRNQRFAGGGRAPMTTAGPVRTAQNESWWTS
jgi:hypothetical protein